jgi:hypothetical protein
MMRIRSLTLLALVGAPLAAQQPAKPDSGMKHRMMAPGMMPHMMQMQEAENVSGTCSTVCVATRDHIKGRGWQIPLCNEVLWDVKV